ncbi:carboxymuconolactone decarboxylase family protein [Natronococcus pandeyae]|uniref:Carboxymuconolactone decarboxylase family protein n=1 Tax=Natronococcus pandeyae TaxID=2055836 RepID=A0A8J8PXK2_9EURY|nr:carboxymuconolactone decarboxylase family protein [Natronococcus pandeyae]TYL36305.1 carboxymuconolactone decarboxylase family protein [Natronococcus pandeyae]
MARVPYVTQDELDPEYRDHIVSSLQPGKTLNVYSAIGNNQSVLDGLREFLGALWNHSGLTDRQREIVILTTSSEIDSTYEWHQHVNIATDAGLEPAEIDAIARDDRRSLSEVERALVAYTRAVVRGRVTDALHDAVVEYVGEETAVGAAAVAAGYLALGRLIDAFAVEIEAGDTFAGWELE